MFGVIWDLTCQQLQRSKPLLILDFLFVILWSSRDIVACYKLTPFELFIYAYVYILGRLYSRKFPYSLFQNVFSVIPVHSHSCTPPFYPLPIQSFLYHFNPFYHYILSLHTLNPCVWAARSQVSSRAGIF